MFLWPGLEPGTGTIPIQRGVLPTTLVPSALLVPIPTAGGFPALRRACSGLSGYSRFLMPPVLSVTCSLPSHP